MGRKGKNKNQVQESTQESTQEVTVSQALEGIGTTEKPEDMVIEGTGRTHQEIVGDIEALLDTPNQLGELKQETEELLAEVEKISEPQQLESAPVSQTSVVSTESRSSQMRKMFAEGVSRGEIAKHFNCRYQAVYAATKTLENAHHNRDTSGRAIILELPDGTKISRREYMRNSYAAGVSRSVIAKEFGVPFQTVYAATRDIVRGPVKEQDQ